jgi:hypothetical protein
MTRTWKFLSLSALAALALASASAPAQTGSGDSDKLEAIQKRLEAMNKDLKTAFNNLGIDIKNLKRDVEVLKENDADTGVKLRVAQDKIGTLERVVNQLRLDIETLQKRLPSVALSRYPAEEKATLEDIRARLERIEELVRRLGTTTLRPPITTPRPDTGRIVLVNAYPGEVLFLINQKPYRLATNQTATIDNQPAGVFTYEVISETTGSRGPRTRVLAAGETYTLTARP